MAKDYIRLFKKYWGYGDQHTPNCWSCDSPANDIHHIEGRKMGGNNKKNSIKTRLDLRCITQMIQYLYHIFYVVNVNDNLNAK